MLRYIGSLFLRWPPPGVIFFLAPPPKSYLIPMAGPPIFAFDRFSPIGKVFFPDVFPESPPFMPEPLATLISTPPPPSSGKSRAGFILLQTAFRTPSFCPCLTNAPFLFLLNALRMSTPHLSVTCERSLAEQFLFLMIASSFSIASVTYFFFFFFYFLDSPPFLRFSPPFLTS